jgi:23S rRNA pseudouridine2605 synthase
VAAERLQKILSRAGIASRRKAEELILQGQVTVNGQVITELGSKADPETDHIKVRGKLLKREGPTRLYLALNKPDNCVTTVSDPQGRPTVMDFLPRLKERVYPVGRLDYHSEGLLFLTNDGDFANALTRAANHVEKVYVVKVNGMLTEEQEQQFRRGVPLSGRRTAPAGLKLLQRAQNPWYEVRLIEGRNQQIRLMFKNFGLLVEKLRRVRIGPVTLADLKPGKVRELDPSEVRKLIRLASVPASGQKP